MKTSEVTFPKVGEKHHVHPIIGPKSAFLGLHRVGLTFGIPPKAVLIFDRNMESALRKFKWLKRTPLSSNPAFLMSRTWLRSIDGDVGVYLLGIGAPMVAMAVEELAEQGTREFLILGTAGGLKKVRPGQVILCTKALRDEGVSHHYLRNSKYVAPDRELVGKLGRFMTKEGIEFSRGPTWTIDAPYRESMEELERYSEEGILTVDMESASLFAVAKVLGLKAAAVFIVSDLLTGQGWTGYVKGIQPKDFVTLARVAEGF